MSVTPKEASANAAVKTAKRNRITQPRKPEASVKEVAIAPYAAVSGGSLVPRKWSHFCSAEQPAMIAWRYIGRLAPAFRCNR